MANDFGGIPGNEFTQKSGAALIDSDDIC